MNLQKNCLQGKRCLVVDDEEDIRFILVSTLEFYGCKSIEAEDGAKAITAFKSSSSPIDFIISDIRMPNKDGSELLRTIRETHPKTPVVIMVTGFADVSDDDLRKAGAQHIFHKPFDPKKIIEALLAEST